MASTIKTKWVAKFGAQFRTMRRRGIHLHFESMGGILALQEKWCRPPR